MNKINLNLIKNTFRKEFDYHGKINWFPPHMIKTRKLISDAIKQIDIVIELRDSRAPLSTENPILSELLNGYPKKSKVIIFNKSDLSNSNLHKSITEYFKTNHNQLSLFTQTVSSSDKKTPLIRNHQNHPLKIIKKAVEYHENKFNINNSQSNNNNNNNISNFKKSYKLMIVGLPNVGKSSFINSIRQGSNMSKSAKTGPLPGVTKELTGFKCCDDPQIFIVDTPGIMIPGNLDFNESTLTLALLNCITERIVSQTTLADFLLFKLNSLSNFKYLNLLKEDDDNNQNQIIPNDNIDQFLSQVATRFKMSKGNNKPDLEMAAIFFIQQFRDGKFGSITLDRIPPLTTTSTLIIPSTSS